MPRLPVAVHPSPVFLAGPLLPAAALFLSGAFKGAMTLGQSLPAIILLVGTYLISRWYRRAALVLDDHAISLGERTVRYDDISVLRRAAVTGKHGWERIALVDKTDTERLWFTPGAYGTGTAAVVRVFEKKLPENIAGLELTRSKERPVVILWIAVLLLFALTFIDGFFFSI